LLLQKAAFKAQIAFEVIKLSIYEGRGRRREISTKVFYDCFALCDGKKGKNFASTSTFVLIPVLEL
jgi:hypothetical protein